MRCHCGFTHVSDDDYARTVIAQTFAHAPQLDPSGTSWLPLPFWLDGAVMMVVGRSLAVARAIAFALGASSPLVCTPACGRCASRVWALVLARPSDADPVEHWLGSRPFRRAGRGLVRAALFFMATGRARWAGALVLVASLSRYEAWPIAALVAVTCLARQ